MPTSSSTTRSTFSAAEGSVSTASETTTPPGPHASRAASIIGQPNSVPWGPAEIPADVVIALLACGTEAAPPLAAPAPAPGPPRSAEPRPADTVRTAFPPPHGFD